MKILAVSDEACPSLWDYYTPGMLREYDLILSCGDLPAEYLTFLVTMARAPLLYVHGNHDGSYRTAPPEGCCNIDGQFVVYHGVRILGLGGCQWYHPGPHQYTQRQMRWRIRKLMLQIKRHGGVDIVVTHAPPEGLGDASDAAHQGFAALRTLIEAYHPAYLVHGHVHLRYGARSREILHQGTKVVNACSRCVLELPDRAYPPEQKYRILCKTRGAK